MASFFAFFGIGSVLGILLTLILLVPLAIYFIYNIGHIIYIWSYVLFRGIDPRTGKPPKAIEKTS